jgi:hypothetical protein
MAEPTRHIIYGAGEMGKRAFAFFSKDNGDAVYCFADDDEKKIGTEFCGKPVIGFAELCGIKDDYDIHICIHNVEGLYKRFCENAFPSFKVWFDIDTDYPKANENRFALYRKHDTPSPRKKILYGAGKYGKDAYYYYGEENVYAFADANKHGQKYLDKDILDPRELSGLQESFEIVLCLAEYAAVSANLEEIGVYSCAVYIGVRMIDDIRVVNVAAKDAKRGAYPNETLRAELGKMDFIKDYALLGEVMPYAEPWHRSALRRDKLVNIYDRLISRGHSENLLYGYADELINYTGKRHEFYEIPPVCHGAWDYPLKCQLTEFLMIDANRVLCDEYRMLPSSGLDFVIGPYLHYVEPFYNDARHQEEKGKLGKTLLVFPVHSGNATDVTHQEDFFEKVKAEAKKFASVIVCVYYTDFQSPLSLQFAAEGYRLVSAGLMFDPSFARRTKSITRLADAVITDGFGSYIFWSLFMGVPVNVVCANAIFKTAQMPQYNEFHRTVLDYHRQNHPFLFDNDFQVSPEDQEKLEPYICANSIKTKEEMIAIFDLCKEINETAGWKRAKQKEATESIYHDLLRSTSQADKQKLKLLTEALLYEMPAQQRQGTQ